MVTTLSVNNFFSKYITDPLSYELSFTNKIIATVASVALAILTVGLIIPITSYFANRPITLLEPSPKGTPAEQTAAKIQGLLPVVSDPQIAEGPNDIALHMIKYYLANNLSFANIGRNLSRELKDSVLKLNLKQTPLSPDQLKLLAFIFPNTTTLVLAPTNITTKHLEPLITYRNFLSLDVSIDHEPGSTSMQDAQIAILSRIPKLETLYISGHHAVSGTYFNRLPATLTALFSSRCNINDAGIRNLAHLTGLQILSMSSNSDITGESFKQLPVSLIGLNACSCKITDDSTLGLTHLNQLNNLDLGNNPDLKGIYFEQLPASLADVDLAKCPQLASTVFDKIKHLANLTELVLPSHLKGIAHQLPAAIKIRYD